MRDGLGEDEEGEAPNLNRGALLNFFEKGIAVKSVELSGILQHDYHFIQLSWSLNMAKMKGVRFISL